MLIKIDFAAMGQVAGHWRGIGVTLFVNWLVKPFSMALLAWIFIRHLDRKSVVEGKRVSVRVDLGGRRRIKKKKKIDIDKRTCLQSIIIKQPVVEVIIHK